MEASHQENVNENYNEILPQIYQDGQNFNNNNKNVFSKSEN